MTKNIKTEGETAVESERLEEIAAIKFENLSDDEVLRLLAERKRLEELQLKYEKLQKEEAERVLLEKKNAEKLAETEKQKDILEGEIENLNHSISPDKADDELLALIAERKVLEEELKNVGKDLPISKVPKAAITKDSSSTPSVKEIVKESLPLKVPKEPEEKIPSTPVETPSSPSEIPAAVIREQEKISVTSDSSSLSALELEPLSGVSAESRPGIKSSLREEFGQEGIQGDNFKEGDELHRYLDQLKNNAGSLGTFLQEMPLAAKKNKAFMLKVAEIDSAYAMHYADKDTLKREEDFNIQIATMKNLRNSGNALAEMLPEARTSKVVLAGVKQDYRNVRFIQPSMADYDEMMTIAKKMTLKKIDELKDAADMLMLIPRPLQQDKQFMAEVGKITEAEKEKK